MTEKYEESLENNLKTVLKERFPQGGNLHSFLSSDSSLSSLSWEQLDELSHINTELSPTYSPKTFRLLKILCRNSEPE